MFSFDIDAIAVKMPPIRSKESKLGTMMPKAYHHLYDKAGDFSRPSSVRRGVTTVWSPPYEASVADDDVRSSDLAADAVRQLLNAAPNKSSQVGSVIHTQCTLDQQILGSTCLRLEQKFFNASQESMSIGQLGTSGLPTAIAIAASSTSNSADTPLVAITVSDKWIAPFFRKFGGTIFSDCGGCLIGGQLLENPVARIQKTSIVNNQPLPEFWTASIENINRYLINLGMKAVNELVSTVSIKDRKNLHLIGDGHGPEVATQLAIESGFQLLYEAEHPIHQLHASSASTLQSIIAGIDHANNTDKLVRIVVWTASVSGHAGALLVECYPNSTSIDEGWVSPSENLLSL